MRTSVGLLAVRPHCHAGLPTLPALGLNLHRAEAIPAPAIARPAAILSQRLHEAHAAYLEPT
ncbi:hypothetical protein [Xanthomonas sp. 3075]|uniref:hypothetical protein n=1 Tax=Xanthomonas sp. 3075 TaxID=3035315 RepID=UPI00160D0D2C|nr:hypothetical protein [Xanthomonas sp. 3075]MBB4129678.1 hypothetical protein [Xanthomonas sp. 3075]